MYKKALVILGLCVSITSCTSDEENPYLITSKQVGPLKKEIKINQLDSIFKNDSIVRQTSGPQDFRTTDEIKIYTRDGEALMSLEPLQEFDSTSTVGYIRILDARYETKDGLTVNSTFKDIVENYNISRIENTINSAVVFIDEINAYITIDKNQLPTNLRYDTDSKIMASQIPDNAKIKYFMIYWN
ncbi:hypothetical protein [Christiangramia sabulilitoris]|uniref:Lipoprotein n=1 Tax=Christiangramia sabulilitoris TaxID=2583991 RepID=A0A550I459_9FLAO|nr:hypothetical protein [Christiangramia sabulilitoris]TRO65618.1 hypothetical protein FGM01_09485 [Christiangramia sabulilitoris]